MGEGAGILVIEELEHALRRGVQPIAEIAGYGTTADAYHITSGPEDGDGASRAMEGALRQAGLKPGEYPASQRPFHLDAGWQRFRTGSDQNGVQPQRNNCR
ncbi:hypothetical protein [Bradyrhizobium sp. CCBAU 53338]|uniref:hypothetical protein n=1 Tax=Bradyrhizobium sp. CCBAU 53338 TaxID=1325111 RepID=UPI00352D71F5